MCCFVNDNCTWKVGNDHERKISNDQDLTVGDDMLENVMNDQTVKISGDEKLEVVDDWQKVVNNDEKEFAWRGMAEWELTEKLLADAAVLQLQADAGQARRATTGRSSRTSSGSSRSMTDQTAMDR